MRKPKIKDCYRVELLPEQGLFLVAEEDFAILTGRFYEEVGPLLTGELTVAELVDRLDGRLPAEQVYYAVFQLEAKGYLVDADAEALDRREAAYWQLSGVAPAAAAAALRNASISIGVAGSSLDDFAERLGERVRAEGIAVNDGDAALRVIITDDYLHPELARVNDSALARNERWLLLKPFGVSTWIGPYFEPRRTGCWLCLSQRLAGHRMVETFLERRKQLDRPPVTAIAATSASLQVAIELAAAEIARIFIGTPRTRGRVLSFDHRTATTAEHELVKRPQCAACGDASMKAVRPIDLASCVKTFTADGGHRTATPEDTVRRFRHHVSPITGIIRDLTALNGEGDQVKHIYGAGHNFAMLTEDISFLRATLRLGSGGKGKTAMQAQASAIGESLERYSGLFQGYEPRRHARWADMRDGEAIHPNACLLFSERQFATRDAWNKEHDRYQYVPERFDPEAVVDWTPVWSLTHGRTRELPTAMCYFGYNYHPAITGNGVASRFAYADSNGCAAGNTVEEAVLQGLLELVERDSVASWWYSRCRRPAIDLDTFEEPYFEKMHHHYATLQRTLWVLDVTNDIGIPTFVAVSHRIGREKEEIVWGCGSHLEPRVGILRALTEVNQFLAAFDRFSKAEDRYLGFDPEAVRWFTGARIEEQSYLLPDPSTPPRRAGDYRVLSRSDIAEDLGWCIGRLDELGMEVLALDQTREDVGLPVVRVVVPGLRHFFARFAPGRLYEVPARLGWTPRELGEQELNPIPVFF